MKLKRRIYVLLILVVLVIVMLTYFLTRPTIVFFHDIEKIEINSSYDAKAFIKKVRGYNMNDVKIDDSKVNIKQLGNYRIVYEIDDEKYELKIEVVDTKAPKFEIVENLETDTSSTLTAEELVSNIQDETKTKVYFKENYDFKKAGTLKVIVVVEDEGKNQTKKETTIQLIDDKDPPVLVGLKDFMVTKNKEINYLEGVVAKDNFDPQPSIIVDDSQVDISKLGDYVVTYTVKDRSGNQKEYKQKVSVVDNSVQKDKGQSEEKIVYLTFDDGPSSNTKKILDILDQYHAKATFFVTGTNQKYNYLIQEAHSKGHTIALHTYSHNYSQIYKSVEAYFDDLTKVGNMVKNEIGYVPRFIRFPGGSSNTISRKYCQGIMSQLTQEVKNRGYQYYDWNADSTDASGNNVPVSQIIKNGTLSKATNINLLCHDSDAKDTTVQALPSIIEYYQQRGYQFKGIDENAFTPHQNVNN